jgi:hypothetical protein
MKRTVVLESAKELLTALGVCEGLDGCDDVPKITGKYRLTIDVTRNRTRALGLEGAPGFEIGPDVDAVDFVETALMRSGIRDVKITN